MEKKIKDNWSLGIGFYPGILFGNKDSIKERIDNTFNKVKERKSQKMA